MIGSLRGTLLHRSASEILVEVQGLGYRVLVHPGTSVGMGDVGGQVFLHVHHHVREDADTLYGFAGIQDRLTFEALLGAHGVGPSMAMGILAVHSPSALRQVLADEDLAALCEVPGVGKKTAARLLLELKSRLEVPELAEMTTATITAGSSVAPSARGEVREALAGLGYGPDEVRRAMAALPVDGPDDASSMLRLALRSLSTAVPEGGHHAR